MSLVHSAWALTERARLIRRAVGAWGIKISHRTYDAAEPVTWWASRVAAAVYPSGALPTSQVVR